MSSPLSTAHNHAVHIACFLPLPVPTSCELFASLVLSIVVVGGSFFPTFAKGIFVYSILAYLLNNVRHLLWANFLQPNSSLYLISDLLSKRVRYRAGLLVTQSFQSLCYRKNALIYKAFKSKNEF